MKTSVWGVAWVAAASMSAPAWAADPGDAKALFAAGWAHFQKQEYEAARESFAQAYALEPTAGTLLNLATAELQTSHAVEAAAHFRAYLARPDAAADKRGSVQAKWLPRAEAMLARVQLIVPAGAEILVDGQPVTQDPSLGLLEVAAGDHEVVVQTAGRREAQHVTAPAGATLSMRALVDDPAPPVSPSFVEEPDQPPSVTPQTSTAKIATVAALGVGTLGALGVGIGFDMAATNKAATVRTDGQGCFSNDPMSVPCQRTGFDVGREHAYEWASIGGFVGAGLLGAAGIATWFLWPRAPVHVAATVQPHEVGFGVTGRW